MPSPCSPGNPLRPMWLTLVSREASRWRLVLLLTVALCLSGGASRAQFDPFKDAAKGKLPSNKSGGKKPTRTASKSSGGSARRPEPEKPRPRPRPTPKSARVGNPGSKAAPRPTARPTPSPSPTPLPGPILPEKPFPGQIVTNPLDNAELVWIPAGTFLMGSNDRNAPRDEKPAVSVELSGFWMYKHPVTVGQYKKFCQATGHPLPDPPSWGWKDDFPMVNVSWNDAAAYCAWARIKLPTEAQWEYAARGIDGRIYPWGSEFDAGRIWYSERGRESPASVLRSENISASPFGIVDMVGNVWQWCQDYYDEDYYRSLPLQKSPRDPLRHPQIKDPRGPTISAERVLRGGSWTLRPSSPSNFAQASRRYAAPPDKGDGERGFRGVFNPAEAPTPKPSAKSEPGKGRIRKG